MIKIKHSFSISFFNVQLERYTLCILCILLIIRSFQKRYDILYFVILKIALIIIIIGKNNYIKLIL